MSNPTFATGNLTRKAAEPVGQFILVKETADGVVPNTANDFPFGAVTEAAEPGGDRGENFIAHGLPEYVRVHTGQVVVKVLADGALEAGKTAYAADKGHVAASGSVAVGLVDRGTDGEGPARIHLFHPSVFGGTTATDAA